MLTFNSHGLAPAGDCQTHKFFIFAAKNFVFVFFVQNKDLKRVYSYSLEKTSNLYGTFGLTKNDQGFKTELSS